MFTGDQGGAARYVEEQRGVSAGRDIHVYDVPLPDPVIGLTVDNCAWMEWSHAYPGGPDPTYTGDDNAATNGPACVTTPVLAANLAPFGGTVCEKGAICTLDVSIDNRGGRLFLGAVGLRDISIRRSVSTVVNRARRGGLGDR